MKKRLDDLIGGGPEADESAEYSSIARVLGTPRSSARGGRRRIGLLFSFRLCVSECAKETYEIMLPSGAKY